MSYKEMKILKHNTKTLFNCLNKTHGIKSWAYLDDTIRLHSIWPPMVSIFWAVKHKKNER